LYFFIRCHYWTRHNDAITIRVQQWTIGARYSRRANRPILIPNLTPGQFLGSIKFGRKFLGENRNFVQNGNLGKNRFLAKIESFQKMEIWPKIEIFQKMEKIKVEIWAHKKNEILTQIEIWEKNKFWLSCFIKN